MSVELQTYSIPERLERLPVSGFHKKMWLIIATAWFFDSIDLAMLTFVLGSVKLEFALSSVQTGLVAGASFLGMVFGASFSGMLGDKFGRRVVLQWSIVLWGLASASIYFVPSYSMLLVLRFALGLGMGMEFPVAQSLLAELMPARVRGRYIGYMEGGWPLGFVAAGIVSYLLMPIIGWRGIFLVEAIPALFVLVIRRALTESPRWLADVGRKEESNRVMANIEEKVKKSLGLTELPQPISDATLIVTHEQRASFAELWTHAYVKRTIMLWTLWFTVLLGYYGLTSWIGVLLQNAGYTVAQSVGFVLIMALSGIPGFFVTALLLDKLGRKRLLIFFLLAAAVAAYLYGTAASLTWVLVFGSLLWYCQLSFWTCMYTWTPELYPTRARATGCGFASGVGRIGSVIGPYLVAVIIPVFGTAGVFTMGAIAFVTAAFAVGILGVETKGRVLEEISK